MKLLVVDDSAMMRKIIRTELETAGYQVADAQDGVEALAKVLEFGPDLITLDVDMPKLNGYDTCFQLRTQPLYNKFATVPVIFVTANDTFEGRNKGFEVGGSEFITKPFLRGEISSTVERILNPKAHMEGVRVLVVEDSQVARQLLDNLLRAEGIKTVLAQNGVEALELLRKEHQRIDLVITDYMMPEMQGDELCIKIRNDLGNKSLPVIFLSAMGERDSILSIFKAGASDYVVKPFAKEELLARIRVHLEARRLNKFLENQVMELKKLNKLKDEFLAITSHDLRAPLNGIMGFSQLLAEDGNLTDLQREFIGHIFSSGEFLLELIGDILYLGRISSETGDLDFKPINLQQVIESSTQTLRHMATPKGQNLVILNETTQAPLISGDSGSLMRIFNNLLSNAIKFTPNGGEIRQILKTLPDGSVSVSVIDSGIGIPPEKIPLLFDKFSKAGRAGTAGEKSTGLGLSITKELVERHLGQVEVYSVVGEGTRFTVTFPAFKLPGATAPGAGPSLPPSEVISVVPDKPQLDPSAKTHCLLVDDNQLNLKLGSTVLKKLGFTVDLAKDGQEAVMKFIEYKMQNRPLEMVFMDVRMPVLDGLEATKRIREFEAHKKLPPTPIFAMTAGTTEGEKQRCLEVGMTEFLSKPINLAQLNEVVAPWQKK